ncbi:MAG: AraC family transcriptional regulator [Rhodospirillaceae bacterium]|nr:MAG: AraC family transcriptional regulator [Rhodospirillaceae bacterium]
MSNRPESQKSEVDNLLTNLEVDVVRLTECQVSSGWRLIFPAAPLPALHYTLMGKGHMIVGNGPAIPLVPHMLVIVPAGRPFRFEVPPGGASEGAPPSWPGAAPLKVVEARLSEPPEGIQRFIAGEGEPEVTLVCGYFRASYGLSIDLFAAMAAPVVEHFEAGDGLMRNLEAVLDELAAGRVGMQAMTTALLKQVFVTLVRRFLTETGSSAPPLAVMGDQQVARAFAEMVTRPGAAHSALSLAQVAGLSRSAFMARFTRAVGHPPMAALRQIRMRHAATLLAARASSIEQVAHAVGYASRSSFMRAFRAAHGIDPSDYRAGLASSDAGPREAQAAAATLPSE